VTSIPTKAIWPYVQQWSLSVQRDLGSNTVGSIAYVGSKGTHLTTELQLNQLVPVSSGENPFLPGQPITSSICDTYDGNNFTLNNQFFSSGQPGFNNLVAACFGSKVGFPDVNTLRTVAPTFGRIYGLQNVADSTYNAMQFTIRHAKGPLDVSMAYTYSHSIDDSSDRSDTTFVNSYDLAANTASSNFDQRHLLNISYVYQLPLLSFSRWIGRIASEPDGTPINSDKPQDFVGRLGTFRHYPDRLGDAFQRNQRSKHRRR
jgi:hypothetical protein